ncbi:MAG: cation transporter [Chitinophagaceae bacterium]|nr:cation transporter [Chitinophagaceae bacterium]
MKTATQNLHVQKWVAGISILLLAAKILAYYYTRSVAVLTDALESIVNVAAGFIGLYSLYVAAKPRDIDHPYGHGKAEFLSAAVEGTLIGVAGVIILYKAVIHYFYPVPLRELNLGIWLIGATAIVNFIMGYICVRIGRKNDSLALEASGKHLQTDTYSTIGIIAGLLLIILTGYQRFDSIVAAVFGCWIIITAYKIIRRSIAGIMDEADEKILGQMVELLNRSRRENWVDLHNLRVIKYGSVLHLDCHLTLPWYLNVQQAHEEVEALSAIVKEEFGESVEMFVHADGCMPFQCPICDKQDCPVRQHNFVEEISWTLENIRQDKKHRYEDLNKDYNKVEAGQGI